MNVLVAESAGFCFGVKRAVEMLEDTIKKYPDRRIFTWGELIHNPDVVDHFKKRGVIPVESFERLKKGDVLVIRAHGVPEEVIEEARKRELVVIDATCPYVQKLQDMAVEMFKQGYKLFLVGEADHPESVGVIKRIEKLGGRMFVIDPVFPVLELQGQIPKSAVFSQTTLTIESFVKGVQKLVEKSLEVRVFNTICGATKSRQNSAVEVAKKVDLMIVLGGYNSANTRRLKEICSQVVETVHIQRISEMDLKILEGKKSVGITAGASTPDWIIQEAVDFLKSV